MLKSLYTELETERWEYIERGHRSAILTIPSILPRDGQTRNKLPQNFQSVGSRGVNNLTSKLLLTLFPPTLPFIRLEISEADLERIGETSEVARVEVEQSLLRIEQNAVSRFDTGGWRPAMAEALRQLVVTGNCLIYDRAGGRPAAYDLRRYVVERDSEGSLLKVVLKQMVDPITALQYAEGKLTMKDLQASASFDVMGGRKQGVEHFIGAVLQEDGKFTLVEEIADVEIRRTENVREEKLPLLPLRFQSVYGSSYGRGYVEDYDGDLMTLEGISRALAEGSLALAKILWLVRPGGITKPEVLTKSPNGAVRSGDVEDVGTVQADKASDLSIAYNMRQTLAVSLSNAFLLNSSVQRNGERVTAEEIRYVAQELEDALGGVYSSLADTVQWPVARYFFTKMQTDGDVAQLPDEVELVIATGLESISRNHKAAKIEQWLMTIQQLLPPEEILTILNTRSIASSLATAYNLTAKDFLRSEEEVQQSREAQQQQALLEQAAGPMASNLTQPELQ